MCANSNEYYWNIIDKFYGNRHMNNILHIEMFYNNLYICVYIPDLIIFVHIYIYIYTCTYTYIYVCIYICTNMIGSEKTHECICT